MPRTYEIRADFDRETIVVYQAYRPEIAEVAVASQTFRPPFSLQRMTWIKPSFLWLMARSQWGQKPGQERILAVRITRRGWDSALRLGVLTSPEPGVYRDHDDWRRRFNEAVVHIQWDPERSIRGTKLPHRSIQVGLSRKIITQYVEEWIVGITDQTGRVRKMHAHCREVRFDRASALLPPDRVYPVDPEIARSIGLNRD